MFRISVDPSAALGHLNDVQERQLPFAVATGLNRTANDAQAAVRYRIQASFKIRSSRQAFMMRQIYISKLDRANKSTWRVVIQISGQFKDLPGFEEGEDHLPGKGNKWIWKPNPDVFKSRVIGKSDPLYVKNLKFHEDPGGRIVGNQRTFMVRTKKSGQILILQRTGAKTTGSSHRDQLRSTAGRFDGLIRTPGQRKAKQGVRMLYQLVSRSHVPAKLQFVQTVSRTAQDAFPSRMREAMDQAMRSAR